jgi:hypothetical protein
MSLTEMPAPSGVEFAPPSSKFLATGLRPRTKVHQMMAFNLMTVQNLLTVLIKHDLIYSILTPSNYIWPKKSSMFPVT